MTRRPTLYARRSAARALGVALPLALATGGLVVLLSLSLAQLGELAHLQAVLVRSKAAFDDRPEERIAELERAIEEREDRQTWGDETSRYRFAAEINARFVRSGVTVLRVLPAPGVAREDPGKSGGAFRYEVVGPPRRLLELLRTLSGERLGVLVGPVSLRVEGDSLRGELTVGYDSYEPAHR